ncbi:hypothetical protein LXA43DRAFT_326477 [Ganoderma leucocontextum]|nr:hypothetical protein LXA43DRAFT_326477 [Ganoderma leucocontextum]
MPPSGIRSTMSDTLNYVNADAAAAVQMLVPTLADHLVIVIISTFLYGVLSLLVATSTYILISQGVTRIGHKLLLLGTLLLYASSVVYWAASLGFVVNSNKVLSNAVGGLFSSSYSGDPEGHIPGVRTWSCIMSAAFTVNICIGDSIVWWRARVLYPDNRVIRRICCFLFSSTFVLGIISTVSSVRIAAKDTSASFPIVYTGDRWGVAAVAFSLATNSFSTSLIGYKAWQHRSFLRAHLGAGSRTTTSVVKMLALLVESGMVYCLIWLLVLAYHICDTVGSPQGPFWRAVSYIHGAALAPAIAIYPMTIVVLVALNKSQLAKRTPGQSIRLGGNTGLGTLPISTARTNCHSTVRFASATQLDSDPVSSCPVLSTLSLGTRVDPEEMGGWSEESESGCPHGNIMPARKGSFSTSSRHSDHTLQDPKE